MLAISHAQLDLLRDSRESECIARLEQSLRLSFPRDVARLSEQQLRSHVGLGIKRCRARGYHLECDIYLYITMMFMLGSYFDEDPQLPWAGQLLSLGAPLADLHSEALHYLDRVAGEENEHLIQALLNVRRLELATLPNADTADFEEQLLRLLHTTHPAKFEAQSKEASHAVVELGRSLAERYSMPGGGAALLAGFAFLMGTGFDRDLVHPWIGETLREPGGDAKVRLLHRRAVEFAEISLR